MAAGSSDDQRRRHADDMMDEELEEGEIVPGQRYHSESDTEEYYNHYSSSESDDDDEATSKTRWYLVATRTGEASCSSSVAAADDDDNGRYYDAIKPSAFAPPAALLACRVCGKEFTSSKAVCGHMKVHVLERQQEQGKNNGKEQAKEKEVKRAVSPAMGWGGTGKRGCSGARSSSRSASPDSEPETSMPVVAAEPNKLVLEPTPLAHAAANLPSTVPVASAETVISCEASNNAQPMHDDAMAIVVVAGEADPPPPTEAVVVVHHQSAPPPAALPVGYQAPPAVHRRRAAAGTQNPVGYTCAECGKRYPTNQALGGHVAGHRNRRVAAAAAAHQDGAGPSGSKEKEEKVHDCKKCGVVFATGVQLGGHMRKHWKGEPIRPKKKQCLAQPLALPPPPADRVVPRRLDPADDDGDDAAQLRLGLPFDAAPPPAVAERAQPAPAPVEGTAEGEGRPAPGPSATGRVILFGIDIGPGVQRPRTPEGSPATKDSAADIGGQQ
ncbi:hypothetical protein PR202_ga10268 [Eleusine coracana subsp. coracana]|uniref:C2H2-type domain-containing protein n=1 Tax=Eleusine coracana subsp. coracana TaxID=191504 RepID=A0AAV5C684_ELECO|nr:hypothetical protein QOZ80_1AG0027110 [Eleusine coracana subsp. coracana]GJM93686.1 hypothetical protein PR202_ga10268 [Eleusine coracana subsp. coracana]